MLAAFHQVLDPAQNLLLTALVALVPLATLLILLAVFRVTAWAATIVGAVVTVALAITFWQAPADLVLKSFGFGSLTGALAVDWITLWGVVIFNTLMVTLDRTLVRPADLQRVQGQRHRDLLGDRQDGDLAVQLHPVHRR